MKNIITLTIILFMALLLMPGYASDVVDAGIAEGTPDTEISIPAISVETTPPAQNIAEVNSLKNNTPCLNIAATGTETAKPTNSGNEWKYEITPYVWLPTNRTNVTYGDKSVGSVVTPSEMIKNLNFTIAARLQANNDKWGVMADYFAVKSEADVNLRSIPAKNKTNVAMTQFAGFWRQKGGDSIYDIYAGINIYNMDVDVTFTPLLKQREIYKKINWVDPVIGLRGDFPLSKKLRFRASGELSGFSNTSSLNYKVNGLFDLQTSEKFSLRAGYQSMGIKRKRGVGLETLNIDLKLYGPIIEAGFKF